MIRDMEELTDEESRLVSAFIVCKGDLLRVSSLTKIPYYDVVEKIDNPRIATELALKARDQVNFAVKVEQPFTVSKDDRLRILWKVANNGVRDIYDKEGNEVMENAAATVSAVRAMNEMIEGSLVPRHTTVQVEDSRDTRSLEDVQRSIKELTEEYNRLALKDSRTPDKHLAQELPYDEVKETKPNGV